jgi:hypothetical protein
MWLIGIQLLRVALGERTCTPSTIGMFTQVRLLIGPVWARKRSCAKRLTELGPDPTGKSLAPSIRHSDELKEGSRTARTADCQRIWSDSGNPGLRRTTAGSLHRRCAHARSFVPKLFHRCAATRPTGVPPLLRSSYGRPDRYVAVTNYPVAQGY